MRNLKFGLNKNHLMGFMLVFGLLNQTSFGQSGINLGSTNKLLNEAVSAMDKGEYTQANGLFREIIKSSVAIPP
jgi:hypothetical protein